MDARRVGMTTADVAVGRSAPWTVSPPLPAPVIQPGQLGTTEGPHLIALDLDGTTLGHDGSLSEPVREAVGRVAAAGHEVVVATGRSSIAALPVIRQLGLTRGYAVCSNGAVTLELDPRAGDGFHFRETVTFDPEPVLHRLQGSWPDAAVAVEDLGVGFRVNEPFPEWELSGVVRVVPWCDLAAGPTTRITFRSLTASAEDFLALAERVGLHGFGYSVGYTAWMDITPQGVSKASAVERVRQWVGVSSDCTVAIGDQRNDLEMLQWAACGVAMADAPEPVRAAANLVTGTVAQDGLVAVLAAVPS